MDPHCYPCQIQELKKQNSRLTRENAFLRHDQEKQFTDVRLDLFYKYGKRLHEPLEPPVQKTTFNYTITFDPNRFSLLGTNNPQEEAYILLQLSFAMKDGLTNHIYGCFEVTQAGVTHAHLNADTYQPVELYQFLKKRFTNDMRNHKCIVYGIAKEPNSIDYINKIEDGKGTENKTWYQLNNINYKHDLDFKPEPEAIVKVYTEIDESQEAFSGPLAVQSLKERGIKTKIWKREECPKPTNPKCYPMNC